MKKESLKVLVVGLLVLAIIIFIKHLIFPDWGFNFIINVVLALVVGFFLAKKIKSVEKS